ncbi:MAG: sugar phosphate isomerase/epimerase [Chlorobi bacterium]|nr:sugar phosphate isomerase/epimerase [Chlorobiota bacterium]
MYTRRNFVKVMGAATAGSMLMPSMGFRSPGLQPGLILYTVRDLMKKDPLGTLKKVAGVGYVNLEAAGYGNGKFYGMSPKAFKNAIEDLGMKLISSHTNVKQGPLEKIVDDALEAGLSYIVYPSMAGEYRKSIDGIKRAAEFMNKTGTYCKSRGLNFAYHNHNFEFKPMEGVVPYDILLKNTDPEIVKMELDLYWIKKGGASAEEYFKNHPGRFELWHVKDMDNTPKHYFTEVGQGIIDFPKLFSLKKLAGLKYYFVENDDPSKVGAINSIRTSYQYLKSITT